MKLIRILQRHKVKTLAEKTGINRSTILRWLYGESSPSFIDLISVIDVSRDDPVDVLNFFRDLSSKRNPYRSPEDAQQYIREIRARREWKKAMRGKKHESL